MKIDYTEFVKKHNKSLQADAYIDMSQERDTNLLPILNIILFILALAILAAAAYLQNELNWVIGAVLILTCFSGLSAFVACRKHSLQEKEMGLVRSVLEGSRAARLITDSINGKIYHNQKFEHLCRGVGAPGYETLIRLFQNNEEAMSHFNNLADQAHRGLTDSMELLSVYEDNERWLTVTVQPVSGYSGYIHWRIDDVTEKYTIDRAIREEREKLIDFTDNAPVGFFSINEEGRFVFANATFARWVGVDLQSLLDGGHLHTYLAKPPEHARPYDLTSEGGARQVVEIEMKGTGGKTFLAAINHVVMEDADGGVRTRAVVHDLTTVRQMRTALKESEARFQKFFEEAPLGIVLVDDQGIVADCNSTFATMLGRSIDTIEQGVFFDLIASDENRDDVSAALARIEKGDYLGAPLEVSLNSENETIQTQMHARRFKESDSTVLHFIDRTEQKQLEEQFVQSQKMQAIGQLAGGIAHDFNNLLTAMIGFCDLLLLRHKPGDPSFGDIMQIKQNSNRAANLVRQLLAFSRQQTLRPKVQDITDILTELSHLMRRLIGASVDLDLTHGQDLGLVKVDEGQMEQVLINLAVNARDAMDGSGELLIETENFSNKKPKELVSEELPVGHWVKIKVSDTGCGIPKENLTRIFEPFFTTKDVGEGTGLGLATVYGIIRQTDGFLDVESTAGKGTSFIIYLPQAVESEERQDNSTQASEEETTQDLTGTERILLVEDEDAVRTFAERTLMNKGYEISSAEDGAAALEVFTQAGEKGFDLLVTDVVMPNMDGPTLAQAVREKNPDLKVIFMSGYTEDKLKDHMDPNTFFLPKPFTLKQLAAKIKEVLDE